MKGINNKGVIAMTQINELLTKDDLKQVWKDSTEKLVFIFKKSTTCPLSADAFAEFQSFLETKGDDVCAYFVKVRETREVSNEIADLTGVRHHSPQVLLLKDQEVLWNDSHTRITVDHLEEAYKTYR